MKRTVGIALLICIAAGNVWAETNWQLQAVNSDGSSAYSPADRATIEGIILNRPEYMLDTASEWQMYVQGAAGDHAGTAVYMRKSNYIPGNIYSDPNWLAELDRISYDSRTGHRFMPGDKVRVNGKTLFYGGKKNINEQHKIDPAYDFTIELVELGAGLPEPELITLNQVKDAGDNFIFDQTRMTGCEYYQARLVRINDVNFVNPSLWAPNATLTIKDSSGKTFPLKLGAGPGITIGSSNLPSQFDVIAIFDQEDSTAPQTGGYRLWVTNYDGNGTVLVDGCDLHGIFAPGDLNKDCRVDLADFVEFAADWLKCTNALLTGCE